MKRHMHWRICAAVAGLAFLLQVPARIKAQNGQAAQAAQGVQSSQDAIAQDPPGRVATLNYMEGSVSFQPAGENDWVTAVLNRPLVTGDNLWTDEASRAEVHIGSTALHLGPTTGITFLEVSDRAAQIRLAQGSMIVKVRHVDEEDAYEVDTPNVAFTVTQPGDYRIDVDPDGNRTEVTAWHGRGEVTGGGLSYSVVAGQYATFAGGDHLDYDLGQLPVNDAFDSWALDRDQNEERSESANYVSRDMTGYEDLDAYGDWSYVASYGMCWSPAGVGVGWAPYHFGYWTWVGPWGWTWVENEPWGFAPFHYGRWAFAAKGWVWVPGPSAVRPVYAPAQVAWVGGAQGFQFSRGAGVGWFPLAPGEVFIPGYRVSHAYVNRVNLTNTAVNVTKVANIYNSVVMDRNVNDRNVNNVTYANRSVSGGVTVVSRDTFVNALPVARNALPVPPGEVAGAPVSQMIEPLRSSVLGAAGKVANRPPAAVTNRAVVALRTPATIARSFQQRQAQAGGSLNQQSSSQPSSIQQSLVRQQPPGRPVPAAQGTSQAQGGFRPFTPANGGNAQAKPQVWEEQGTPEPEQNTQPQPESGSAQASRNSPPAQPGQQQWSHPPAKPVAPVQRRSDEQPREQEQKFSNGQQPKPTSPPPAQRQQNSHPPAQSQGSATKTGH